MIQTIALKYFALQIFALRRLEENEGDPASRYAIAEIFRAMQEDLKELYEFGFKTFQPL